MKVVNYNINNNVWVKLTPKGKEQFKKYYYELFKGYQSVIGIKKLPKSEKGWYKFQMWELMEIFGPSLYMGCSVPFETEVRIEVRDEDND